MGQPRVHWMMGQSRAHWMMRQYGQSRRAHWMMRRYGQSRRVHWMMGQPRVPWMMVSLFRILVNFSSELCFKVHVTDLPVKMTPCCRTLKSTTPLERTISRSDSVLFNKTAYSDYIYIFQLMRLEMQQSMDEERQKTKWLEKEMMDRVDRIEKEMRDRLKKEVAEKTKEMVEKTNRLEKEMAEKTSRLKREVEAEQKKSNELVEMTNRMKQEMEAERNKTSKLEKEIMVERKRRDVLEVDVDDLKQSTNDIADWIVAGVCCHTSLFVLLLTHL